MKIEFELKNKEKVLIYGIEDKKKKLIGHIFTPSGSGSYTLNAIQICGFEEAYDLWGCGIFGEKTIQKKQLTAREIAYYKELSKSPIGKKCYAKLLSDGYEDEENIIMKKDIQLMFSMYDNKGNEERFHHNECWGCYNKPCTCENKDKRDEWNCGGNPYKIKSNGYLKKELIHKESS